MTADLPTPLNGALASLYLPARPFRPALTDRALVLLDDGSQLSRAQLEVLAEAGGSEVLLVDYIWDWDPGTQPVKVQPMDLREGYPPVPLRGGTAAEHALVAVDGSWAFLSNDYDIGALAGPPGLVAAVRERFDEVDAAAARYLLDEAPEWGPDLLAHLYGEGWEGRLGVDRPAV